MGLIIATGNTTPKMPYDYYYGVKINPNVSDPALERVGRMELHASCPVQSAMRRCLLRDDGTVSAYLHPTDSAKTDTGARADLSGAAGQVMVEIPRHYRKFETAQDGTFTALISQYPLPGFSEVPRCYISAYQAVADRTVAAAPKLCSVVNTTAPFRGGANTAAYDGTYRSLLGCPSSNISLTNFRAYARRRGAHGLNGAGWNCLTYEAYKTLWWLYTIEYANLNSQAPFNAQPDANGCRQGGLGIGVSTLKDYATWNSYNGVNPFVPCGHTNSLGNATGTVDFTMPAEYVALHQALTIGVPSYRGVENPFGHVFQFADGCKVKIQSDADGGRSYFYVCHDPAAWQDADYTGYDLVGETDTVEGYISRMMLGSGGHIMPTATAGSSTRYYCDYAYKGKPETGTAQRAVLFGGGARYGAYCGLSCSYSFYGPADASSSVGSRLCFIPA